jgi:glycosyltransferase involved in cell wall biosynthesis
MRVLVFGTYERGYPRTVAALAALRRAGADVIEWNEPVWSPGANWSAGVGAAARLARARVRLARRRPPRADVVLVPYPGHLDVAGARRAARGAPVVWDALVSLSDTLVADRRRFRAGSLPARVLERIDRRALRAADLVVADTAQNADFLRRLGGLPPSRVAVVPVGAEERVFHPGWKPVDPPLFVGKLIPLHGLETILEAARLAPELRFRVVGRGQLEALLAERPGNVEWVPWIPYEQLGDALRRATAALGIFGVSAKASRVVPNKAYQALACGTPLVTADTPAARTLLVDGESALLVPPGDPVALAQALRRVRDDAGLARAIGAAGRGAYERVASEAVLAGRWQALLEALAR